MQVDPGLRIGRQQRRFQLARRQQHLLIGAIQPIAVDIHVQELVIGPDFLELGIGVLQRPPVPQPDVVDGRAVGLERGEAQPFLDRERFHRDLLQVVGLPRRCDVARDIGRLQIEFARLHIEALEERRDDQVEREGAAEQQRQRAGGNAPGQPAHIDPAGDGAGDGQPDEQPQHRQPDMEIGVAGADDDAVVAVEQQVAVEAVGPGLHREVEAEQRRGMGEHAARQPPRPLVELDVAVRPIHDTGDCRAEDHEQQQPVLERDIGRQREEIEADVLAEHRIARAVGHLVEEAKHDVPVRELDEGGQQAEKNGHGGDENAPRDVRRGVTEKPERGLRALSRERPGTSRWWPNRRLPGEAEGQSARKKECTGRDGEDDEEEDGAGGDDRPEDVDIADRRKPQPIDQDGARPSEHDQANDDDRDQDRKSLHGHGTPSFRRCRFEAAADTRLGRALSPHSSRFPQRGQLT